MSKYQRIWIHLICMAKAGHLVWHIKGILREFFV